MEKERVKDPSPLTVEAEEGSVPLAPEGEGMARRVKELGLLPLPLLSSLPSFFHLFFTNIKELSNFMFQVVAL